MQVHTYEIEEIMSTTGYPSREKGGEKFTEREQLIQKQRRRVPALWDPP